MARVIAHASLGLDLGFELTALDSCSETELNMVELAYSVAGQ